MEHVRGALPERYWKKVSGERLPGFLRSILQERAVSADEIAFVCIGTDRSTGDALGPLVGSSLKAAGCRCVIGTLEHPCDASNLLRRLGEIPPGRVVLAIDACLGQPSSVGLYQVSNQPLSPGKSVGKQLPQVGDYTIAAIVNADGPKQYSILQTTSLRHVMRMAAEITEAVREAFALRAAGDEGKR